MQFVTNHPFGPNGPYYGRPCLRDRFPSLLDEVGEWGGSLVEHLGSANIENMGARHKKGRKHDKDQELRDANENLLTGSPRISQTLRTRARSMRRAHDTFAPRMTREPPVWAEPLETQRPRRRSRSVNVQPTAERQAGEPPYVGKCDHCRRHGTDDAASDFNARTMAMRIFDHRILSNQHQLMHCNHFVLDVDGQRNIRNG
ncbi:uncharacterized protein [Drosophila pseudoobscura]|uniref:Uncharacterized protein n=1 Tax=Drosophila pseudoobscura pseudoobscura TaxID=46245 RepID=B5DKE1_DROPS|nr:uncharacterized protein LOC6902432 [Drosophila pseudoobscura]